MPMTQDSTNAVPAITTTVSSVEAAPLLGRVTRHALQHDPQIKYHLYLPSQGAEGAPLLVCIHGISRNAKIQAQLFADLAEAHGMVVVAPRFTRKRFPAYQRLSTQKGQQIAQPDQMLNTIITEVGRLTGARCDRFHLFGYSGGGQFAHRYAMRHPQRVITVSMGAPGWYSFPDRNLRYPRGIRAFSKTGAENFDAAQFLQIPMTVFVGEHDNQRDTALNTDPHIDRQQGANRIERGRRWIDAMQQQATRYGYTTPYRFALLPGAGHSFSESMQSGRLGEQIFSFISQHTDRAPLLTPGLRLVSAPSAGSMA